MILGGSSAGSQVACRSIMRHVRSQLNYQDLIERFLSRSCRFLRAAVTDAGQWSVTRPLAASIDYGVRLTLVVAHAVLRRYGVWVINRMTNRWPVS